MCTVYILALRLVNILFKFYLVFLLTNLIIFNILSIVSN